MTLKKALFLDRDGVINVDYGYVYNVENLKFINGIFELCRIAKQNNYLIVVVTNQAGIGRGYYSEEQFFVFMNTISTKFAMYDLKFDAVYFCPHHPVYGLGEYKKNCNCRKPKPGMFLKAKQELNLAMDQSIMVGDKVSDIIAAKISGITKTFLYKENSNQNGKECITSLSDVHCFLKERKYP